MNPLNSVGGVITAGIILAVIIAAATMGIAFNVGSFIVWIHVLAGITWIGLLYYFNFVQVPALADAAGDEGGPGGAVSIPPDLEGVVVGHSGEGEGHRARSPDVRLPAM